MENVIYCFLNGTNFPPQKASPYPEKRQKLSYMNKTFCSYLGGKIERSLNLFFFKVKNSHSSSIILLHEPKNLHC